jgi:hypothetical protein
VPKPTAFAEAAAVFLEHGGILRTKEALGLGVHPRTLYAMRDAGRLERLGRGLYRLASLPPLGNPDLVAVALRVPEAVLCLISALAVHEITTQIPHEVYIALKRGAEPPRLEHPPVRVFGFSGGALERTACVPNLFASPQGWQSDQRAPHRSTDGRAVQQAVDLCGVFATKRDHHTRFPIRREIAEQSVGNSCVPEIKRKFS